jgi:hypothetical protein
LQILSNAACFVSVVDVSMSRNYGKAKCTWTPEAEGATVSPFPLAGLIPVACGDEIPADSRISTVGHPVQGQPKWRHERNLHTEHGNE